MSNIHGLGLGGPTLEREGRPAERGERRRSHTAPILSCHKNSSCELIMLLLNIIVEKYKVINLGSPNAP